MEPRMSTAPLGDSGITFEATERLQSEFLKGLDPEMRAPLNGIVGLADLLTETQLDERQKKYVSAARMCAQDLLEQLSAAFEFAALDAGQIRIEETEFHLPQLLHGVTMQFRCRSEARGIHMEDRIAGDLPEVVIGDGVRLRNVLTTVLSNAIKMTPQGSIEMAATAIDVTRERIKLAIVVRDTGIADREPPSNGHSPFIVPDTGADPQSLSQVPLGLSVAKRLIVLMHGEVLVMNEGGQTTPVSFWIPLRKPD